MDLPDSRQSRNTASTDVIEEAAGCSRVMKVALDKATAFVGVRPIDVAAINLLCLYLSHYFGELYSRLAAHA